MWKKSVWKKNVVFNLFLHLHNVKVYNVAFLPCWYGELLTKSFNIVRCRLWSKIFLTGFTPLLCSFYFILYIMIAIKWILFMHGIINVQDCPVITVNNSTGDCVMCKCKWYTWCVILNTFVYIFEYFIYYYAVLYFYTFLINSYTIMQYWICIHF